MASKFYNYSADDLEKDEPEYKVPLRTQMLKIMKYIIIASVAIILIIVVGIENINKIGIPKS